MLRKYMHVSSQSVMFAACIYWHQLGQSDRQGGGGGGSRKVIGKGVGGGGGWGAK